MAVSGRFPSEDIDAMVARYYTDKVERHGPTPRGADWTCLAVQELRFVQLLKICNLKKPFSLNDIGCGYGALLAYLEKRHGGTDINYLGVDISAAMIRHARALWRGRKRIRFAVAPSCPRVADIAISSGIFNVKLNHPVRLWEEWIAAILKDMRAKSRVGFAVNFMMPAAALNSAPILYRTHPDRWITYCSETLGCDVDVLAGYGLREFTLLARPKQPSCADRHEAPVRRDALGSRRRFL